MVTGERDHGTRRGRRFRVGAAAAIRHVGRWLHPRSWHPGWYETLTWRQTFSRSPWRDLNAFRTAVRREWRSILRMGIAIDVLWRIVLAGTRWYVPGISLPPSVEHLPGIGFVACAVAGATIHVGVTLVSTGIRPWVQLPDTGPFPRFERASVRLVLHPEGRRRLEYRLIPPPGSPMAQSLERRQGRRAATVKRSYWLPEHLSHDELEAFLGHPVPVRDRRHRAGYVFGVRPPTGRYPLRRRRIP